MSRHDEVLSFLRRKDKGGKRKGRREIYAGPRRHDIDNKVIDPDQATSGRPGEEYVLECITLPTPYSIIRQGAA